MKREDVEAALVKAESVTDRFLIWRSGLPAPFTFAIEAILWLLAALGAWRLLS